MCRPSPPSPPSGYAYHLPPGGEDWGCGKILPRQGEVAPKATEGEGSDRPSFSRAASRTDQPPKRKGPRSGGWSEGRPGVRHAGEVAIPGPGQQGGIPGRASRPQKHI